jgi:hypothetical protein
MAISGVIGGGATNFLALASGLGTVFKCQTHISPHDHISTLDILGHGVTGT